MKGTEQTANESVENRHAFLHGGGELGVLIRAKDWSATPLGPIDTWPQSLKTTLGIVLNSRYPMFVFWGPQLLKIYNDGYRPIVRNKHPWALGRPAPEVWPEIWADIKPLIDRALAGEPTWSDDLMLFMERQGFPEEVYFTFSYSPVPDESGGTGGMFCACTETTGRVLGERRLRTLRDLAAAPAEARTLADACALSAEVLASNAADVPFALVYLMTEDGTTRLMAHAGLGVGDPIAPIAIPSGSATADWPVQEVARLRSPQQIFALADVFDRVPPGPWPEPPTSAMVLPLVERGLERGVGAIVLGISSRRPFDAEYREWFDLVAGQVGASVSNARAAEEERKRAEALAALDHAKTVFFSNVSHEFRTPLTLMLGPIDDALTNTADPLSPLQREQLELVRRNGLRLQKLVNTLLDFSRIEAGRGQASFIATDLSALTTDLASSFRAAVEKAGLTLVVDCPPLPEAVYVDPSMWEKVVLNLLSNAFKFTFAGTIRVTLRWAGEVVQLSVEDSGIGIPQDELPRIFERFHRVEHARARSHEGTGIGLALVRELVNLHGGTLDVESTLGKGTVFRVTLRTGSSHLPIDRLNADARTLGGTGIGPASFLAEISQWSGADPEHPLPSHPAPHESRRVARILVADDNADMRNYIVRLLSPRWQVDAVADGAQALAAIQADPPDLVLADVMMPRMDGLELLRRVRADERTRTVPVTLLSARAGEEATIEGLASGADEYLVKPFSAHELLARVNAQLTAAHHRREAVQEARSEADQARKLLSKADDIARARQQVLEMVSHDLRSPLSTIDTAAHVIARGLPGDERPGAMDRAVDAIGRARFRMERLIGDLLDMSNIEAGTLSIEWANQNVSALVHEAHDLVADESAAREIQTVVRLDPDLPDVSCDRERMLQVLANLLSNAIKFTDRGGRIELGARRVPAGIEISVSDTGAGIQADAVTRVFDRYWHTSSKEGAGHGLGLAIAKGIVDAHRGSIDVESAVGRGTTFRVVLPLASHAPPVHPEGTDTGPETEDPSARLDFLAGGGELGALMRSTDWSRTAFGPVARWPQSLRTALSIILESKFPMVVAWGPDFRYLYNDAYRPLLGGKHPTALGRTGAEIFPEAWHRVKPLFERTRHQEAVAREDVYIPLEKGNYLEDCFFSFSLSPIRVESGGIGGTLAVISETTARVEAERRLATLRDLARRTANARSPQEACAMAVSVLEENPVDLPFAMIYLPDDAGRKATLAGICGLAAGTAASPAMVDLDDEIDDGGWPLKKTIRLGEPLQVDTPSRFGALSGGAYPESPTRALLLPLARPLSEGSSGVLIAGVSARRALDESYRTFFELVAEHITNAITNTRTLEAERQRSEALAEIDREKTAFFSNVSHEFRTPLTLILGPVEDALRRDAQILEKTQLELVRRNALRLFKMVNSLLDFARMEAGRAQATFVPTDISAFTCDLASAFRSAVEIAGLTLEVDCDPSPEAVYIDAEMWEKVVLNLLSNAVKYTYAGSIRVELRWETDAAVLAVRDTGVGIPADELSRIFERFHRVRGTRGRSYEGTGIGLALVQELVRLHGGTVEASSAPGSGTTFTIRIPRGVAHVPAERLDRTPRPRSSAIGSASFIEEARRWSMPESPDAARARDDVGSPGMSSELAGARILVADDNADLRAYVTGLLRPYFPGLEAVSDGQTALERARAWRPDLVLADVMMPRLDGFGLARGLRADPMTRAIPIILLSARAGEESTVEGLASGADDYLVKPFSARELIARVTTHLEMAEIRRQMATHHLVEDDLRRSVTMRNEFLTLAAHELRTPLATLRLQNEQLQRIVASSEASDANAQIVAGIDRVAKQTARLEQLVENLLDASALTVSDTEQSCETLDLRDVARDVIERLAGGASRQHGSIEFSGHSVVGYWDRSRLERLLTALITNSLKFAPGYPVNVRLDEEKGRARLLVSDRGIGIAPEDQQRIFDRFERAVSSDHYGGLGLGLWIVRQMVESMGGAIQVQSEVDSGATFIVELPVRPAR